VVSDADESTSGNAPSSPTSETAEDGISQRSLITYYLHFMLCIYVEHLHLLTLCCITSVSLNGCASDHCFGDMEIVSIFSFDMLK
jgi:hypothetical protein